METEEKSRWKRGRSKGSFNIVACSSSYSSSSSSLMNSLDDGCIMHIFSFLSPIPDRYNAALVSRRWYYLACHPRLWLRVDQAIKDSSEPGVFPSVETAVSAARPGDTILIGAGGSHHVRDIQIKKPLCLLGEGEHPDETTLVCSRGSESAFEFLSTCKLSNLTVKAELGCCLLHRSGRLTIERCILQCDENPLDYLSCAIVSTAKGPSDVVPIPGEALSALVQADSVSVSRTRIEGGSKAVSTVGTLALQRVRVIYSRTALLFWFDVK
ncbi:hypothetical protein MKW92_000256 [Papaver armeniacum]|nr:hypothetical protein MKW92_000256 [Papaver armeniacum]